MLERLQAPSVPPPHLLTRLSTQTAQHHGTPDTDLPQTSPFPFDRRGRRDSVCLCVAWVVSTFFISTPQSSRVSLSLLPLTPFLTIRLSLWPLHQAVGVGGKEGTAVASVGPLAAGGMRCITYRISHILKNNYHRIKVVTNWEQWDSQHWSEQLSCIMCFC